MATEQVLDMISNSLVEYTILGNLAMIDKERDKFYSKYRPFSNVLFIRRQETV